MTARKTPAAEQAAEDTKPAEGAEPEQAEGTEPKQAEGTEPEQAEGTEPERAEKPEHVEPSQDDLDALAELLGIPELRAELAELRKTVSKLTGRSHVDDEW